MVGFFFGLADGLAISTLFFIIVHYKSLSYCGRHEK